MKKWFRKSFMYRWLVSFLTWFGDLRIDFDPPATKAKHLRRLMVLAEPGDVLCRKFDCYVDSIFIEGEYTHSGILTHKDKIIHSIAEGVIRDDILDFVLNTDGFILLRPKYDSESNARSAVTFAENHVGRPYDFLFQKEEKESFYCHELTARSLGSGSVVIRPKKDIIYASDIMSSCRVIYESDEDK